MEESSSNWNDDTGPARSVGAGFFPLDEELALEAGSLTPQMLEWLVRLAVWMPFGQAVHLLTAITKVKVGEETARRQTEQAGRVYEQVQDEEAKRLMDPAEQVAKAQYQPAERQVISADGAMVPLLHGEWAEVKTLVIAEQKHDRQQRMQTVNLSYFSRMTAAEDFADRALVETRRRGLEQTARVAAVTDGAVWLQGLVDMHCPEAVRILDFPHAAQRIGEIAEEVRTAGTPLAPDWVSGQLHDLKQQGPPAVLTTLCALRDSHPTLEKVSENVAYLEKRAAQMQYPQYQAQEWPIGSGMVESANKQVMQARLKGPGMHWAPKNVNPLLALRTAVCNDRWEEAWSQRGTAVQRYKRERQQAHTDHRLEMACRRLLGTLTRLGAFRSALVSLPVEIKQAPPSSLLATPHPLPRPAPDHPWRRRFLPPRQVE